MIKCCGLDTVWVENVPGKGYNYCRECKKETESEEELRDRLGTISTEEVDNSVLEMWGLSQADLLKDPDDDDGSGLYLKYTLYGRPLSYTVQIHDSALPNKPPLRGLAAWLPKKSMWDES